jgi:hypothetical protein
MIRWIAVLLVIGSLLAETTRNVPDISGTGSVVQLKPNTGDSNAVQWVLFVAPASNSATTCGTSAISGCPRVGGSTVSTTDGVPLVPGSSRYYGPKECAAPACQLHLTDFYYLVQSGDELIVEYGQ